MLYWTLGSGRCGQFTVGCVHSELIEAIAASFLFYLFLLVEFVCTRPWPTQATAAHLAKRRLRPPLVHKHFWPPPLLHRLLASQVVQRRRRHHRCTGGVIYCRRSKSSMHTTGPEGTETEVCTRDEECNEAEEKTARQSKSAQRL